MQAEDRLIHFSTELIFKPIQLKTPLLQKLYYELSQTKAAYDSSELSLAGQPPRFYSRRGRTQSLALFLPDRCVLVEEWVDIALVDFYEKVREVAARALDVLDLPMFVAQTATLRSTFALTHFDDARVFLMDHMCNQRDRISPWFQRPIGTGGLRFVLPETPEHRGALNVAIEPFRRSRKEVFVEVKGIYAQERTKLETIDESIERIQIVRAFMTENIFPYLNQFDTPREEVK